MDIERFVVSTMPSIEINRNSKSIVQSVLDIRLRDLWKFYEAPSYYGQEIFTLGGSRGPSEAYYLPYLSAIQLFIPASDTDQNSRKRVYTCEEPPEGFSPLYSCLFRRLTPTKIVANGCTRARNLRKASLRICICCSSISKLRNRI
eukprot:TRINITY_DN10051_c0_g1_i8.p2 TRINITY_DN10051_c0_g1~~TRINITY_DN10051_c0_g1_i8.p2  ORF type:complete len:146 (-),score=8.19 TRINITY_DN10051_c0_g1_i8:100-537(-)